jgi:hypothetical protein
MALNFVAFILLPLAEATTIGFSVPIFSVVLAAIALGEPIPKKRREALPGVRTCVACQSERDKAVVHSTINRRGSKDSQLR